LDVFLPVQLINNLSLGTLPVWAMTTLHDSLYVAYDSSEIAVFNNETLQFMKTLPVHEGLENIWDLASCRRISCIYISDRKKRYVHKIDEDGKLINSWSVRDIPHGLSVNEYSQLLVTCDHDRTIKRFSKEGTFLGEICLPRELIHPVHSVQLSDNTYAVCVGREHDDKHMVVIVRVDEGRARKTRGMLMGKPFGGGPGAEKNQLNTPYRLAVSNGYILVDDAKNGRVLQLRQSTDGLEFTRILVSGQNGDAYGMWHDEERGRLYLSANTKNSLRSYSKGELKVFGVTSPGM
jgi:hypothetical protein